MAHSGNARLNEAGQPFSFHPDGVNIVMIDGSVRFIVEQIEPTVTAAIASIGGAENVKLP